MLADFAITVRVCTFRSLGQGCSSHRFGFLLWKSLEKGRAGVVRRVCGRRYFLSPLRGWCGGVGRIPTAYAVGCILSPLRGLEHCRFYNPLGAIEQCGIFNRFCYAIEGRWVSRLCDGSFATSDLFFRPSGARCFRQVDTHGLRRGLHSFASSRLSCHSVLALVTRVRSRAGGGGRRRREQPGAPGSGCRFCGRRGCRSRCLWPGCYWRRQ